MYKEKLLILGKSGSGKNFTCESLVKEGLKQLVKETTRPKRKGETQGIDYNYIDDKEFLYKLENGHFLTYQSFKIDKETTWYYGISKEEFEKCDMLQVTPGELDEILKIVDRDRCFVVYLDIDKDVREERILERNDNNDSLKRRLEQDDKDFSVNIDFDLKISDPYFETGLILDLIE